MPDYQHLTHDELLRLALEKDQLTDEARLVLDAEISSRRISSSDIASFQDEFLAAQAEEDRDVRAVAASSGSHIGKKFFGMKNRTHDARFRIEEYDTTLWFFAFWFPIFPMGSYRIRRLFHRRWHLCTSDEFHVLQKLPKRDWEQILVTWIKAMVVLLVLRFAVPFVFDKLVYR
jgi:hypothetical protein